MGGVKYGRYQGLFLSGKFLHFTQNQDLDPITETLKSLTGWLGEENEVATCILASLYCCRLGVNNPIAEVLVPFVNMLHLSDLTSEDVKPRDDLYVWSFVGFSTLLGLA